LLCHTLAPINARLDQVKSGRTSRGNFESDSEEMSFDNSDNVSFSENEEMIRPPLPINQPSNPWYILPRSSLVGSTHIELEDYCVSHTGPNAMVDLGSRNGRHVIRKLRDIPTVAKIIELSRLESEVEKETSIPNASFIKAPLNSTLQKELGWKV